VISGSRSTASRSAVGIGELAAGTVEGNADNLRGRTGQAEGKLVLHREVPKKSVIQAEPVEAFAPEEVADPDRLTHLRWRR